MADYLVDVRSKSPWQYPVKDKDTLTPPSIPVKGDRYLIKGIGAGGWIGKDNQIAYCSNAVGPVWTYIIPTEGFIVWIEDENKYYQYITSWTEYADGGLAKVKIITSTRNLTTASGDVSYTGVGFKPKAVIIFACIDSTVNMSLGMSADGSVNGAVEELFNANWYASAKVVNFQPASAAIQTAIVKTWDVDGITLTWTKTNLPTGIVNMKFLFIG